MSPNFTVESKASSIAQFVSSIKKNSLTTVRFSHRGSQGGTSSRNLPQRVNNIFMFAKEIYRKVLRFS